MLEMKVVSLMLVVEIKDVNAGVVVGSMYEGDVTTMSAWW
jgi:hypothetical protein